MSQPPASRGSRRCWPRSSASIGGGLGVGGVRELQAGVDLEDDEVAVGRQREVHDAEVELQRAELVHDPRLDRVALERHRPADPFALLGDELGPVLHEGARRAREVPLAVGEHMAAKQPVAGVDHAVLAPQPVVGAEVDEVGDRAGQPQLARLARDLARVVDAHEAHAAVPARRAQQHGVGVSLRRRCARPASGPGAEERAVRGAHPDLMRQPARDHRARRGRHRP